MSTTLTLQAALALVKNKPLSFDLSIPSGTILVFTNAESKAAVAEMLWQISPQALADNQSQLTETIVASGLPGITDGDDVLVTYGAAGARQYHAYASSPSPSRSPSLSPSASLSRSPSVSPSLSPSASLSRSPSASPSAS